jgi:hypothetical protein
LSDSFDHFLLDIHIDIDKSQSFSFCLHIDGEETLLVIHVTIINKK